MQIAPKELRVSAGRKWNWLLPVAIYLAVHIEAGMKYLPYILILTPFVADLVVNYLPDNSQWVKGKAEGNDGCIHH